MRHPKYAPFPTEEFIARYQKAQRLMDERGFDALLVTTEENGVYFSGLETLEWAPNDLLVCSYQSRPT